MTQVTINDDGSIWFDEEPPFMDASMRQRLPNRRFSVTSRTTFIRDNGDDTTKLLVTVGFDGEGNAKEVFCADFKSGSDFHAIIIDSCILISRLLQHGVAPAEILASLTGQRVGHSLLGTLVNAVVTEERVMRRQADDAARAMALDTLNNAPPAL